MRALLTAAIILAGLPLPAVAEAADLPACVEASRKALQDNFALGGSSDGEAVTAEEAAEAERSASRAVTLARACVEKHPDLAAAHHLLGMALCTCYRPVEISAAPSLAGGEAAGTKVAVLRRCPRDPEEGLAELRESLRIAPADPECRIGYAEALEITGHPRAAGGQALLVWKQRASLSDAQIVQTTGLLARVSRATNRPEEEARWLRELIRRAPDDQDAVRRLAELSSRPPKSIAWCTYEHGMDLARRERKPVLVLFETAWCQWCKRLDKTVLADPEVIRFSSEFICVRVDAERRRDLAKKHRATGFPTTVFVDHAGRELRRIRGYKPAQQYLEEMKRALRSK